MLSSLLRLYLPGAFQRRIGVVLLITGGAASLLLAQQGATLLPFTIQRLVIPPERVAKELERVQQGALYAQPLEEFESRLERVRQRQQAREQMPRLLRCQYSAELVERTLTNGSGQWLIMNPSGVETVLPIESMNLALHQKKLRWEQGGEVVLGEFDGKALGLLVKHQGSQTCLFDWSARGTPTSEGLSFHLRVPPCPLTTFEIKLPADLWLSVGKSTAIVSGPHETEVPSKRSWKIQITGQTKLEIFLRTIAGSAGTSPTIFAQSQSWQQLALDRVLLDYKFNVDILHGSVRELILEGDAAMQPYDVVLKSGDVQSWHWTEPAPRKDIKIPSHPTGLLTIRFRQPVQGELRGLRIRSLAPLPTSNSWTSPGLWVRSALPRGETLKIQLHPQLPLARWDHGSFQLTSITTETDGTQILTLADPTSMSMAARRPSLLLQPQGLELHTRETSTWQLDSQGSLRTTEWEYSLLRGNLYQLTLQLSQPAQAYRIESVDLKPAELLRNWHVSNDQLIVELKQGLAVNRKVTLTLRLRSPLHDGTSGGREVEYPEVLPHDSTRREGSLAIRVDRIFQSQLLHCSLPLTRLPEAARANNLIPPSYAFTFRDQSVKAVLRLVPQPVLVQLRGQQKVVLSEHGARLQYDWDVEPLVGAPRHLDFRCPEGLIAALRIKADPDSLRIQHWERLHQHETLPHLLLLGTHGGMGAAILEQALPADAQWRFHFATPLHKKARFTLEADLPAGMTMSEWQRLMLSLPGTNPWEWFGRTLASEWLLKTSGPKMWSIPLMISTQRQHVNQEVLIESPRASIIQASASCLQVSGPQPAPLEKSPVHALLYQLDPCSGGTAKLLLCTDPQPSAVSVNEWCDEARLTTVVNRDGVLSHHLKFRLWHWHDRTCVLRFSAGVQVVAARIQDRWLQQLEVVEKADGVHVVLPMDQQAPVVHCEILARSSGRSWIPGLFSVEQPRIEWPLRPVDFRSRYRLESDLIPLSQEGMIAVGVPEGLQPTSSRTRPLHEVWNWGQSWFAWGEQGQLQEKLEQQRETVLRAEAHLRSMTPGDLLLSDALQRLALQHLQEEVLLVVDQTAMQTLGLSPKTLVPAASMNPQERRPFWTSLGLIYVACPSGALLTSAQRLKTLDLANPAHTAPMDAALRAAVIHGRDSSTAFIPAVLWSRMPSSSILPRPSDRTMSRPETEPFTNESTEWEFLPGTDSADTFGSMYLVDRSVLELHGCIVAILMGVLLWRVQRIHRTVACLRVYLLLILATILTVLWLPATLQDLWALPVLGVVSAGFLWFLITLPYRHKSTETTSRSTIIKPMTQIALWGILVLGAPWIGSAQSPVPRSYSVLILKEDRPIALVPMELKKRLDELEKPAKPIAQNAILMSAKYTGKFKEHLAGFEAQYELFSARDNASLILPLTGVQLQEEIFLDGAPAFPTLHKNGYFLKIPGKGYHHLRLSFSVRATSTGEYQELRFTVPKLLQNEIGLQWSSPVQSVHSLHGWGEEKSTLDARLTVKEWRAQLGYETGVHLRWTSTTAVAPPSTIEVQEMHFWDLHPDTVSLQSSLNYVIGKGSLTQIVVALPEGLNVRAIEAMPFPQLTAPALPLPIKQWQVIGKGFQRRITVDLVQPVTNQLQLNLEIVPEVSFQTNQLLLPLPAALQGKSVLGYMGYRIAAAELRSTAQNLAVQRIAAKEFADLWKKNHPHEIPMATRAYSFQRKEIKARLELVLQPLDRQLEAKLVWKVDLHHADLTAKFAITSNSESMMLQEFVMPPALVLAQVQGPDVVRWNLHQDLLQVWLRRPCKEVQMEIKGWHRLEPAAAATPKRRLHLPSIHPLHAQFLPSTLEIRPLPQISITQERLLHLQPQSLKNWFAIDDFPYEASFLLEETTAVSEVEGLTQLQRLEGSVEIWCGLLLRTDRGRLPPLQLHLKDWPCETLLVEAPGVSLKPAPGATPQHLVWQIPAASGLPQEVVVAVRGQITSHLPPAMALPVLELENHSVPSRWILWKDLNLVDSNHQNIPGQAASPEIFPPVHLEPTTGLSSGWRSAQVNRPVRVLLPRSSPQPKMRLLGSTEHTWLNEGQHWVHEANYWIQVLQPSAVQITFPAATDLVGVFIDDRLSISHASAAQTITLPLSATSRPQQVRLLWTYAKSMEPLDQPRLESLLLDQAPSATKRPVLWVPAGMSLSTRWNASTPTLLHRLLERASVEMQMAAALVLKPEPPLDGETKIIGEHQKQFYTTLRLAGHVLAHLKKMQFDTEAASERMQELKRQNHKLAMAHGYDKIRITSEKDAQAPAPTLALPLFGLEEELGQPLLVPEGTTRARLHAAEAPSILERRNRSEILLLVFLSILVVTFFRHRLTLLQRLFPELILALSLIGMWWFGLGLIGVMLIGLMLLVRSVRLARRLRQRWQAPRLSIPKQPPPEEQAT